MDADGDISPEESRIVQELRTELRNSGEPLTAHYDTDFNLLRWIRTYGGDRAELTIRISRHLRLRRLLKLDTILEWTEEREGDIFDTVTPKYGPMTLFGRNSENDNKIVAFEFPGRCDVHGLRRAVQSTKFMYSRFRFMESARKEINKMEAASGRMSGAVFIIDLQHLSFDPTLLPILTGPFRVLWESLNDNYPDWVYRYLIVNAPAFLSVLWKAFRPFVHRRIKDKIVFTSSNWRNEVAKYVAEDHLPVYYGGSMSEIDKDGKEDPYCQSKLAVPPLEYIPRELYWTAKGMEPDLDSLRQLRIPTGKKSVISYEIDRNDLTAHIFLYCETEHTFGVFCHPQDTLTSNKEEEEVWPEMERPGMFTLDHISLKLAKTGLYQLKMSNRRAWLKATPLKYQVTFMDPFMNRVHLVQLVKRKTSNN